MENITYKIKKIKLEKNKLEKNKRKLSRGIEIGSISNYMKKLKIDDNINKYLKWSDYYIN